MRLVIYGRGGHGREMAFAARPREVVFHSDDDPIELRETDEICIAVGSPQARRKLAEKVMTRRWATIVAPTAAIDPSAEIGEGAQICDFSYIGPQVKIGRQFQCNVRSHVHHDSVIGDYVTLSPGTLCLGTVHIGDEVFVGAGAILRNGSPDKPLVIGAGAIIGMGAVVTKDVPPGATVMGNPASERPDAAHVQSAAGEIDGASGRVEENARHRVGG